jgi:hypothetical protein
MIESNIKEGNFASAGLDVLGIIPGVGNILNMARATGITSGLESGMNSFVNKKAATGTSAPQMATGINITPMQPMAQMTTGVNFAPIQPMAQMTTGMNFATMQPTPITKSVVATSTQPAPPMTKGVDVKPTPELKQLLEKATSTDSILNVIKINDKEKSQLSLNKNKFVKTNSYF